MNEGEIPTGDPLQGARNTIQSLIDMLGPKLPAAFWDDPFVLGFIYFAVHAYAIQAGATDDDLKNLPAVYVGLLEGDAPEVLARSATLHRDRDPAFLQGLEHADKFTAAMRGMSKYDDDETVIRAHEQAREAVVLADEDHPLTFDQALFVYLYEGLFAGETRRRFPEMVEALN
jgi:hypothetical protein